MEQYTTDEFEASGYKWKLILYPKGNNSEDVKDHISLYISMSDSNQLAHGWEINALFKFYLFDQINNLYFTMQGKLACLCATKPVWGIPRFMSVKAMSEPSCGYVVDDTCVLGVEVFVGNSSAIHGECLMLENFPSCKYEWKIFTISSIEYTAYSEAFSSGDIQWKIKSVPHLKSGSIVFSLKRVDSDDDSSLNSGDDSSLDEKIFAEFSCRFKPSEPNRDLGCASKQWFNNIGSTARLSDMVPLRLVQSGISEDGCFIVEAEVKVISRVQKIS